MIERKIGVIDNEPLYFCQCLTEEEAQEHGLPRGMFHFWKHKGEQIKSPGNVVMLTIQAAQEGKLKFHKFMNQSAMQAHYADVVKAQKQMLQSHVDKMRETAQASGELPPQVLEQYEAQLDQLEQNYIKPESMFPGLSGDFRPTKAQAITILGEDHFNTIFPGDTWEQKMERIQDDDGRV